MTPTACHPRSPGELLIAVRDVGPEGNPELQRRDVTGDGVPETFCNVFVRLVLARLRVTIPPVLANALFDWFPSRAARDDGWEKVSTSEAQIRANWGRPTIGVWRHPTGKHGHVVLVVPTPPGVRMHTAQAGRENWSNAPIERAGLIADAYSFFSHP